jgi:hypothetical protein
LPVSEELLTEVLSLRASNSESGIFTKAEQREIESDHRWIASAQAVLAGADHVFGGLQTCWIGGHRGVRVLLTGDHERYRELLTEQVGAGRAIVEHARATQRELRELQERVHEQSDDLRAHGIFLSMYGTGIEGFKIEYQAWDPEVAEKTLRQRFGDLPVLHWRGASNHTFTQFPFGSWRADGRSLVVFYGLPHNGEAPGSCQAFEDDTSVVVSLTIKDWLGAKTAIGGFTPSHATLDLAQPLNDRMVIDASANRTRPHWTKA